MVYKHFKNNYYLLLGEAIEIAKDEVFMIYMQLWDTYGIWVRPKFSFFETIYRNDQWVKRFALATENEIKGIYIPRISLDKQTMMKNPITGNSYRYFGKKEDYYEIVAIS